MYEGAGKNAHLNLREDLKGNKLNNAPASPRSNEQQKTDGVKNPRLDERRGDRLVQSASSI